MGDKQTGGHFLQCAVRRTESAAPAGLPPDLIEKAARRLGVAALVYAGAYAVAYTIGRVASSGMGPRVAFPQPADLTALGCIAASIAFFFVARGRLVSDARLLDVGLVYMVVAAAGIDQYLFWGTLPPDALLTGISWVGVWIVAFSLLVPSTTGKVLLASLAAASTTPLLYMMGRGAMGAPELANTMPFFVANYICAGIAVVASRVVFNLGTDLGNALRMGSYQLIEQLGQGGMGEVWKAEHRMLARPAAIKLVSTRSGASSTGSSPETQRLEREVQATAQLRSPHTVEVYDYGLTDDGRFYYVMELLEGLDLEQLVERHGPMPAERVAHVLEQACHSLAEAHESGLVHRDIKPANIFLCRYGRDLDFVKVLDFGLVKRAGELSGGDVKLTEAGGFAGTPAYGSPESAEGGGAEADPRSDIYSLGCVAYWLLTGATVFQASSPMLMLVQHLHTDPEPPSKAAGVSVPPELDNLVLSCLEKQPADRPASVDEIMDRLRHIRFDRPWSPQRAREWWGGVGQEEAAVPA